MKTSMVAVSIIVIAGVGWFASQRLTKTSESPTATLTSAPLTETKVKAEPAPAAVPPPPAPPMPASPTATVAAAVEAPSADRVRPVHPMVSLAEMLRPNNEVYDPVFGMSVRYPEGWSVRNVALRWGENKAENTIFFRPPEGSRAVPSMYYRRYSDGPAFDMTNPESTLRDMARQKEESRSNGGQNDYRNDHDSYVFRQINGNPSLSYFATYSRGSELEAEYFMRILGPQGYVMFFVRGPASDVKVLIPSVYDMGGTVRPP